MGLMVLAVLLIWAIEVTNSAALDDWFQRHRIQPRELEGLDGIIWAPFLHSDVGHLASNSFALLALGGLVAARGMSYWVRVTAVAIVVGGALTWELAGSGNHIGASGVIFGYLGALLGAAVFERRPRALAPALLVSGFWSSLLVGLVPQDAISWEGHLFGMLAGIVTSRSPPRTHARQVGAAVDCAPGRQDRVRWPTGQGRGSTGANGATPAPGIVGTDARRAAPGRCPPRPGPSRSPWQR